MDTNKRQRIPVIVYPPGEMLKAREKELRQYEVRYEMSSEKMAKLLALDAIRPTADVLQWYSTWQGVKRMRAKAAVKEMPQRLLELALTKGALRYGDFTLTSGRKSGYYFDGRLLSLDPEGAFLIGQVLLSLVTEVGAQAIGGLTLGAAPIVSAVALTSYSGKNAEPIPAFIIRKDAKIHGSGQTIEGPLPFHCRVAVVDDTCATGDSLFRAIAAAEAVGCSVVKVLALLDRREGGGEELKRRGYDFTPLMVANAQGQIEAA